MTCHRRGFATVAPPAPSFPGLPVVAGDFPMATKHPAPPPHRQSTGQQVTQPQETVRTRRDASREILPQKGRDWDLPALCVSPERRYRFSSLARKLLIRSSTPLLTMSF